MKKYKLYILLLSGLLLPACSNEEEPSPSPGGEDAFATISVSVDGLAGTKAAVDAGNENAIKSLTVVFIDTVHHEVAGQGYSEPGADGQLVTRLGLKTGKYKMLLIANKEKTESFDPANYYDGTASLENQAGDKGFVMSNIAEPVEITSGDNIINGIVKRMVGRVDLTLVVGWTDLDLVGINGLQFKPTQVFLANVRPQSNLFDTSEWPWLKEKPGHPVENTTGGHLCGIADYQKGGEIEDDNLPAAYLKEDLENKVMNNEDMIEDIAQFYAMPNSDTKEVGVAPVILYIKGDLYDNVKKKNVLSNRYYRIKLAKGVERNTTYKIEATIQGKGSPTPGDNKENIGLSTTIIIQTWDNVTLDKVTIDEEFEL